MKYLITGGCGFLGSNIASEILKRNDELIIFDNLYRFGSTQNLEWLRDKGEFNFIHGDIRNAGDVENVIKIHKPDVIYHLAGQVAMTTSIADPRMDFEVNALGSFNVLDSIRKYSPETILIYSSTNKVYGDLEWTPYEETDTRYVTPDFPNGFPETITLDFHSPYGCSKGTADQYMLDFHRMFDIKTVVFRHSSMYGGRQFATYDQGWIGWFCQKALEKKNNVIDEFTISGNGKQVRDVLHVDDVVSLYFKAVERIKEAKGQAYNIGGGMRNSLSLLELFEILEKEFNVELRYKNLSWRESDQKVFVSDITKVRERIGWQPKIDTTSGIKKMLEWIALGID
jgi:CDP-paratose 2-epimerase